ncbi:hypothetical protein KFK09_006109 [Dendrobium nobile]|uniref:Transmembrane protein n=1 Tax=Dendrobium nobile TaxID=94219 RepID=A0A8T3BSL9_DENNO|nr:hypothetical protein KFK09_006109 [Dendrobium nobile]
MFRRSNWRIALLLSRASLLVFPMLILIPKSALGTWFFSVAGALIAIPVGIRKKSLAPLVFFGTTGTMLDIIMGISQCEREYAERQMKLMEEQNPSNSSVDTLDVADS